MTIQSSTVRVIYNGNNSTVVYYPVTFVYAVSTEVRVLVTDADSVNTELTFGTDYTVDPSGVLTTAAWDDTHTVTVYRVTDTVQLTDYVENDKFPADTHEDALDKLTRICQEIRETLTRTLQVSVNAPLSGPVPASTTRFLFIDDAGQFAAITPVEALAELNVAAGIGANYTMVFANASARAAATPLFIGQIGVQLDTTGLNGFYRGTSLSAGGWAQVFLGSTDIQGLTSARLLGRYSSGSGNSEEIQIGTGLNLLAGILSASASAPLATEITGVTTDSLIGRDTAGTGNAELLGIGAGLLLSAGVLSSLSLVAVTLKTSSGTHNFNASTTKAIVFLSGGGGGADGCTNTGATTAAAAPGASSGAFALFIVDVNALVTKSATVTIGAAGNGGSGGADGTNGGTSSWVDDDNTVTCNGGVRGNDSETAAIKTLEPPAGGSASGGLINVNGSVGGWALVSGTNINATLMAQGGKGADSPFGAGGKPGRLTGNSSAGDAGSNASGYGAGGGGGARIAGSSGGVAGGGNGSPGVCLILEFA